MIPVPVIVSEDLFAVVQTQLDVTDALQVTLSNDLVRSSEAFRTCAGLVTHLAIHDILGTAE